MPTENRRLTGTILTLVFVAVLVCIWRITTGTPGPNEALLLSVLLTAVSIFGSWVASRYYAEFSFNKNLRMFALKAAEKVTNLSNELDRLSMFLQQELKETEYDSPKESVLAKNLRIEGAIHIINTLKSANDKSLSDWQGVIGDEITARREVQEEREEMLRDLLERLDSLPLTHLAPPGEGNGGGTPLRSEIESLRSDVRLLASQVSGVPVRQAKPSRERRDLERKCPSCGEPVRYRQRATPGGVKAVECVACGSRLYSREADGDFVLGKRLPVPEEVTCPACTSNLQAALDPVPGAATETECPSCKALLRVVRCVSSIRVKLRQRAEVPPPAPTLGEDLLARVAELMGAQPWPTGRGREVARQMGIHASLLNRAVDELIRRGTFKLQIDGRLFAPELPATRRVA